MVGVGIGFFLGFVRSFLDNDDIKERKKLRRAKYFTKKKTKEIILDRRLIGIVSVFMVLGLPYYLGHESQNPVFFGIYSFTALLINITYILILTILIGVFVHLSQKIKN